MKKFISMLLAAAMIVSLLIVATIPTAAVEGDWVAVGRADQYDGSAPKSDYESVAGYYYDDEGFHLTAANWAGQTPWARFVSKDKVDLKDGVYMEIRIDEFNFANGLDSWFTFIFWDNIHMTPGEKGHGNGVYNHIRPTGNNINFWYAGDCDQQSQTNQIPKKTVTYGNEERTVFIAEISWDAENSTFAYTINGVAAPSSVIKYMNEKWGGADSLAYVGFALQHSELNGKVACTLLKYGTSADDCATPTGDDSAEPEDWSYNYVTAPLVEDPNIAPGQPAIFMNGNVENSNIKSAPMSTTGEIVSINDDYTIRIVAGNASTGTGTWTVENATSYAIEDFPVAMMVTRNLCTCKGDDLIDGKCGAFETGNVYIMTGDNVSPGPNCQISNSGVSWDSYYIGEDSYLSFTVNVSELSDYTGRINGVRFDAQNVDITTPGANVFDVCFIAFFASEEDAEAYFMSYIEGLGYAPETESTSEQTTEEQTTAEQTEVTSSVEEQQQTTSKDDDQSTTDDLVPEPAVKNGCGSVVGFGSVAVVAVISVGGVIAFKRKED